MKTMIKTRISPALFAVAIAGAVLCGPHAATAAGSEEFTTKTVAYSDLNLDTKDGAKVFYSRLRTAARTVCSSLEGKGVTNQSAWNSCYAQAIDSAVAKVNNSMVTLVHNASANRSSAG